MERRSAPGDPFDMTGYCTLVNAFTRTVKVLGLRRESRDPTLTIYDYLARRVVEGEVKDEEDGP
jgi:hypothetical protein